MRINERRYAPSILTWPLTPGSLDAQQLSQLAPVPLELISQLSLVLVPRDVIGINPAARLPKIVKGPQLVLPASLFHQIAYIWW